MIVLKLCSNCKKRKPITSYCKNISKYDGLQSECKKCKYERGKIWWNKSGKKYYQDHKQKMLTTNKEWRIRCSNLWKGINKSNTATQRTKRLKRIPKWSDINGIREFYKACPDGYHVDHIIPLQGTKVSGLHVLSNLQYLPAKKNLEKGNKLI